MANEEQIIITADVTSQANDKRQVVPMVEQSKKNLHAAGVDEKRIADLSIMVVVGAYGPSTPVTSAK